jgi:sRNA-binding protein
MTTTKQDIDAALARLAEAFPQTFVLEKYWPHRPLKIGIAADIRARCPTITRRTLAIALSIYTRRIMYLQAMVEGAMRVDLDGAPAGEVTARDAEYAAAKLAGILASREAKRVAAGKPKLEPRVPCVGKANDVSSDMSVDEPTPTLIAETPPAPGITPIAICDEAESTSRSIAEATATSAPAKVLPLKERPVLRLPAFRQKCG